MSRLALALALALLASCAEIPLLDPAGGEHGALGEALAAARAAPAAQKAALQKAEERFASERSAASRLRLGTLLATLPPPLRDDLRAAELLEPLAQPSSGGAGRFATFLLDQVRERQRLAREVERLSRELDRAARERVAADKERDKREEALRQQLEALRAIERNILEREERLRRRAR